MLSEIGFIPKTTQCELFQGLTDNLLWETGKGVDRNFLTQMLETMKTILRRRHDFICTTLPSTFELWTFIYAANHCCNGVKIPVEVLRQVSSATNAFFYVFEP